MAKSTKAVTTDDIGNANLGKYTFFNKLELLTRLFDVLENALLKKFQHNNAE